ncbi:unnamed protein product (macronuclear) [Paramecium tetraurelia]|uniref:HECT domain-containing protein n=1 Tax=Paramecium tetraurelia TaxID=5888 RepID=A0E799_PARTE|nr:uncharacterized protein GSPATT00023894001 [Paramecium tetraurelia]CAK91166.1 unnamed protein product [Paramecium tetraurelia]|eukprot:XP_001458563.1 hypothetical protein (macronuclear) [Paramecium tetraurelia strain d4-2]
MGCCASAANEISIPENNNPRAQLKKQKQQIQKNNDQFDSEQQIINENQKQVQIDQQNSNTYVPQQLLHKTSLSMQKLLNKHSSPQSQQKSVQEEELNMSKQQNEDQVSDQDDFDDSNSSKITFDHLEPEITSIAIRQFLKRMRSLKKQFPQCSIDQMNIVVEVEEQIYSKKLKLDSLNEICLKHNKSLIDILSLINQHNFYLIELILLYVDDYEIIEHVLLNHSLPNKQMQQATAIRLINKMKPLFKSKEKIEQTIKFIQSIFYSEEIVRVLNQLQFINIDSYKEMKDYTQMKLFGLISKLILQSEIFKSLNCYYKTYKEAKTNYQFQNLIVPKSIPLGQSTVTRVDKAVLIHLQFNIFHQVALKQKWDLFLQYSNDYYLSPNISQVTPMMMLFQNAPFHIINEYITLYPYYVEKSLHFSTKQGKNLIHCFCLNKSPRTNTEIQSIIDRLNEYQDLLKSLLVQPYNEQIPLVTYLDAQKEPQDFIILFLSQHLQKEFDFYHIYLEVLNSAAERNQLEWRKQRINPSTKYFYSIQNNKTPKRLRIKQYEEQNYDKFDIIYFQYIQVAKQLIKHKFKINLNWITNFDVHSTHYPYEFSGIVRPLLIQLVQLNQFDLINQQVELLRPYYKQQFENDNEINIQSQFISKLIQILKQTQDRSQLTPIIEVIKESIDLNPQLLKVPLHGYLEASSKCRLYCFDCIYNQLIDLNDKSFDQCYKAQQLQQNELECLHIIRKLFLNNKLLSVDDQFINSIYANITFVANFQTEDDPSYRKGRKNQPSETDPKRVVLVLYAFKATNCQTYNFKEFIQFLKKKEFEYTAKKQKLFDEICNLYQEKEAQLLIKLNFNDNFGKFPSGLHLLNDYFEISNNPIPWSSSLFIHANQIKSNFSFIVKEDETINFTIFNIQRDQFEKYYDWSLSGLSPNLVVYPKEYPVAQNYKEKAVFYALQNHKPFAVSLITIKECLEDLVQSYLPRIKKFLIHKLSLKHIIQNKAFENLYHFVTRCDISFDTLASILAHEYFPTGNCCKQNDEEVEKFNADLIKLFENVNYQDQAAFNLRRDEICFLFSFINIEAFGLIKPNLEYQMKNGHLRDIILSCRSKEVKVELIKNMPDDQLEFYGASLIRICQKDNELMTHQLQRVQGAVLEKETLIFMKVLSLVAFDQRQPQNCNIIIELLKQEGLKDRIKLIQNLYAKAYLNKDEEYLNYLLGFLEQDAKKNKRKMNFMLGSQFSVDDEYINYFLALKHKPCFALNCQQYKRYLIQNKFNIKKLYNDYLLCLREGLNEKIEILNELIGSFDNIQNKETFCKVLATILIEAKIQPYNESLLDHQQDFLKAYLQQMNKMERYQYFSSTHPYTLERKQLKQKNSIASITKRAQEQFDNSQKVINHQQKKQEYINNLESQLMYEQDRAYSKQNQNYSCLFSSSINSQSQNYEKCFEIVQKWANQKNLIQLSPFYERMYALRYPNKQQVHQKEVLVEILIKYFLLKKNGPKILDYRSKEYIELLKVNCTSSLNKYILDNFRNIRPKMLELFVSEFICEDRKYDPSHEDLDYIMMTMKYQNIKLVPIMRKKYKGLSTIKFNSATLFYAKNEVNILPEKNYDVYTHIFELRMEFFRKFISGVSNINNLTSNQVFLFYGKHNHILQKPKFSYKNLVLALYSGNIETINYIISLHQNPNLLVYEQNIFQLIIYGNYNDNEIIKFYNHYIKDEVKQTNRIFVLDNQPILYYLMLMKRQRLFEEIYLPFMIQIHGENKAIKILNKELLINYVEQQDKSEVGFQSEGDNFETDILSLALMRKNYFILNYCSSIINHVHLKSILHFDINYFQSIQPQINNTPFSKFIQLYQKYLPLCCTLLEFKQNENIRQAQIQQLIQYEQACMNQIFNLDKIYYFNNKLLTIHMGLNKWNMLGNYQFNPILLQQYLEEYRQNDGSYNLNQEQCRMILEQCQKYTTFQNPIYDKLAAIYPKLFIEVADPVFFTISTVIVVNHALYQTPELINYIQFHQDQYLKSIFQQKEQQENFNRDSFSLSFEQLSYSDEDQEKHDLPDRNEFEQATNKDELEVAANKKVLEAATSKNELKVATNKNEQKIATNKNKMPQKIAYAFYLLLCIQQDQYQQLVIIKEKHLVIIKEVYLNLLKFDQKIQKKLQFLTENSKIFLFSLLNQNYKFKDTSYFEQILEKQNSKELAILKGIMYIQQINEIINGFINRLSQEITTMTNFKKNVLLVFGQEQITYEQEGFTIPLQFEDDSFYLSEANISKAIPQLKMANYQMNIEVELTQYHEIQENWKNFDFSSITTVDFHEIIINSKENVLEKCLFFKNLMEQEFDKVGIYQIDDVFAPHQHEQIRQTDTQLFQSQGQPPSLIHQSHSQMGVSSQGTQLQRQSTINQQQIMKEDFQFMFELLPDNTYQVRQKKKYKNQKELIFAEFYHFIQPQVVINLLKLSEEEFINKYNGNTVISMIIQDFYRYNEFISSVIEQKQQQVWKLEFPFYIKNQHFVYQDQLFSTYNIQMIFTKLVTFIEKVKQLLGRSEDQSKLVWRINTISFLEVIVSKLVEMQQVTNKVINVYSIIESVFSWDTLIMILHQLLYHNLIKAQQVLKVIRGVYVEFNEQQGIEFIQNKQKKGLDRIFQFGNTTYLLYNHILIIRLNIGICNQSEQIIQQDKQVAQNQQISRIVFKPDPIIQEYFHSIINEYDFYNQIFNPEQLVQYLFNKLDIDRHLLNYSNQLSKILNKTITLSVDHQSLASIFSSEIQKICQNKNSKSRLKEMEQIWYILLKLNKYFKEELYNYILKQIKAERFDEMFNIRLSCLLSALRQNQPLTNIIVSNTRQLQLKQKSKILQRLCSVTQKSDIKLSYHFGFQISKNYYVNNSKLGDVCMIVYCENQKNNLVSCQLVYNSKPGHFLFSQLDYMSEVLLTHDRITRNQAHYSGYTYSHHELLYVQIEDLVSIVLFQPIWPSDPIFNQSILNVFFTDQDGNISKCNEPKFVSLMSQIQCEQDEFNKQDMLDNLFGNGLVSSYNDLSLTQLTPIFPDQINFDFAAIHQFKKQQSLVQGQTVYIRIFGDKFKFDQIEIASVSMACHFETNVVAQQLQKNLIKFLNEHTELANIFLHFDDQLNQNPNYHLDCLLVGGTIFESFQYGYQTFKDGYSYPKLNNSLQYLFDIQSIQSIKINFIKTFIEKVEFIFEKSIETQKQLIQYENRTLKFYTLIDSKENIQVPDSDQIAQFLFNLILKFQINKMDSYFTYENLHIVEVGDIQVESIKTVVDIILLAKYLFKLLTLINPNIKLKVSILAQKEIKTEFKNTIYQFIQDGSHLIINYETFADFNICDFFLDYLNKNQFYINNRYNDKIKFEKPEIILESLVLKPRKLLSGIDDKSQIEILVFNLDQGRIQGLEVLNPQQFNSIYLIFKVDGIHLKFQTLKSCTSKSLPGYFSQNTYQQNICNPLYLMIFDVESNKPLEPQLSKIDISQTKQKNTNLSNLIKKEKKKGQLQVSYKFITNRVLMLEFLSDKVLKMQLKALPPHTLSMVQDQLGSQITFEYTTQNTQDLSKTTHKQVTIENKVKLVEVEQEEQVAFGIGEAKMMKLLLKKSNQKMDEVLFHKECEPITHSKDLQLSNTINMLSKQELGVASRAGQERIDYIEFKDSLGNRINNFSYSTIVFVHSLFNQIQYIPKQEQGGSGLNLIWTPIFKGVYKLYIDDVRIKGRYVILANMPNLQESEIEIPQELQTIPFYEDIPFTFQLRDSYSNIYGDIEYDIYLDCKCEITCNEGVTLQVNFQNLTKSGFMNAKAHFSPDDAQADERETEIKILINYQVKKVLPIKISGVCLEKRRKKFEAELEKSFKRTDYSLVIRRLSFLKDLLVLADKKMNYNFTIKFQDEPGIDAGGLKREFYDMVGNTLKDDTYKFFQPVQGNLGKYFLHSNFNKIKNKKEYALLFGKLIANAIANGYLIGIDIISPFWKVVYDEKIVFEDLVLIWDKQTYSNYANLKSMSPETIESLYLDFTYQIGNSTIDLIPNGSVMPVTSNNVHQYLDKTAEYIIYKQFQEIYKSFIEGFRTVIFQKWLKPFEISLLTQGLLEIKPDVVLQKIQYSGGKANHKSYFETYINQADPQTLKNMLKFITGSSTIPFDQGSYIISVEFKSNLDIRKLPLAHTCFKSIEVPLYANYGQMKQKLDIAFTIGLEGYGFG